MTIEVEPRRQIAHPIFPSKLSRSLRSRDDKMALKRLIGYFLNDSTNTYVTNTDNAPNGVTRDAGAKAYAAKLHASPTPIIITPAHLKFQEITQNAIKTLQNMRYNILQYLFLH